MTEGETEAEEADGEQRPLAWHVGLGETDAPGGPAGEAQASPPRRTQELAGALAQRRAMLEGRAQTFESSPEASTADASHLEGLAFGALPLGEWLNSVGDPEEDRIAELAEAGLQKRGPRPAHAPKMDAENSRLLKGLVEELERLRKQVVREHEEVRDERGGLSRREAEIQERERALREEHRRLLEQEELRDAYPRPAWMPKLEGTVNVCVVGNSGVGKSLLINRLRGILPGQPGWAAVGVRETTEVVSFYAFPTERRLRLWDMPGAGTQAFPLGTYVSNMGLRYFDTVIVVTAGRFTETEVALVKELERYSVPYVMVRTKADIDIWNNGEDNGASEDDTLRDIRADLRRNGAQNFYVVSLRDTRAYDFEKLKAHVFPFLQPDDLGSGWDEAWSLPHVPSATLSSIQGRWSDLQGGVYLVNGAEVHVTRPDGQAAAATLDEDAGGKVWWCGGWWIDVQSARKARATRELRWAPVDLTLGKPWVWRWAD